MKVMIYGALFFYIFSSLAYADEADKAVIEQQKVSLTQKENENKELRQRIKILQLENVSLKAENEKLIKENEKLKRDLLIDLGDSPYVFYPSTRGIYHALGKDFYPLINLNNPNGNLWTEKIKNKLRGKVDIPGMSYKGSGVLLVRVTGEYVIDFGDCRVQINNKKVDPGKIRLTDGMHTVYIDTATHSERNLSKTYFKATHAITGEELFLFNSEWNINRWRRKYLNGEKCLEVVEWNADPKDKVEVNRDGKIK